MRSRRVPHPNQVGPTKDARVAAFALRGHSREGGKCCGRRPEYGGADRAGVPGMVVSTVFGNGIGNGPTSEVACAYCELDPESRLKKNRFEPWPKPLIGSKKLTGLRRGPTQVREFMKGLGMTWQLMRAIPLPPKKSRRARLHSNRSFLQNELTPRLEAAQVGEGAAYISWMLLISCLERFWVVSGLS